MIIGIDARFVGPEGTGLGKYTEKLIKNLLQIDSRNQYRIFLRQNNWSYLDLSGGNVTKVLADVPWYSLEEQLKMAGIYKSQNLNILHIPHFNVPLLYNLSFVVTIHDLIHHKFSQESATTKNPIIFKTKRLAYRRIISHAIKKSKKIITPSNYVKREIINTFKVPESKIVVTYEAAEEEYFTNQLPTTRNQEPNLLYVGNTYPHKNIGTLLDAINILKLKMRTLPEEVKNIKLFIVCPRDIFKSRLEKEIAEKGLTQRVEILPYQNVKDLTSIFAKVRAYVFPSLEEGFGIPGLNAMAAGLPLIASNIPTLKEVYGDSAVYFNPNDPTDIAQKINKVITSSKISNELIKKGKTQAQKYSWQKMAQETLDVYTSCI